MTPKHILLLYGTRLVKGDGSLDGGLVTHRLKTLLPLLDLEHLVNNAVDPDLAGIQVVYGSRELVGLREGAEDGNFVAD